MGWTKETYMLCLTMLGQPVTAQHYGATSCEKMKCLSTFCTGRWMPAILFLIKKHEGGILLDHH